MWLCLLHKVSGSLVCYNNMNRLLTIVFQMFLPLCGWQTLGILWAAGRNVPKSSTEQSNEWQRDPAHSLCFHLELPSLTTLKNLDVNGWWLVEACDSISEPRQFSCCNTAAVHCWLTQPKRFTVTFKAPPGSTTLKLKVEQQQWRTSHLHWLGGDSITHKPVWETWPCAEHCW